ncbi:MGMT family protein [Salinirubellus salinus]|jgi:methylated-DNA-[protein]-cysteine S-methyltransferase|uniref:MGMT family protein n=1 Tax=Salinirubellus salinus TaxID=1364945 RepID=A0A9E7R304_9EURY|nr:MGMT family protein [Salinirubellus salinus]UWM54794.1 MGMT family protein [Salinirubellus salinus]
MDDPTDAGIFARESPYLDRYVELGVASGRLLTVRFPGSPDPEAGDDHPLLDRVFAYLEGERDTFRDVDVALSAATPDHAILQAVRELPYAEDSSVQRVARLAGLDPEDQSDLDRVRQALADNPAPIFVPDHRVRDGPSAAPPAIEQRLRSLEGL